MKQGHRLLAAGLMPALFAVALVLVAFGGQPSRAEDGVMYVDAGAPGPTHDGTTWATAFTGLQAALDAAVAEDEIWVAAGVYTPTWQFDPEDPRSAAFQMANGVAIYGGFNPSTGDTAWEDRDWAANPTILSGDVGTEGDPADNSYHVFYHPDGTNLDNSAVLDGFTITGGYADGDVHDSGGGMYNHSSSPALTNVTFVGNHAGGSGGGLDNEDSAPVLDNCTFQGNTSGEEGGGMHNGSSSPTLTGCTFSGNTADAGGGIYNGDSSPALDNVTFAGNEANSGGGMHNDGSMPVLFNCTFWGNSAKGHGGGVRNTRDSFATLTNCTFHGNTATNGGAIQNYLNSPPTVTNCILWGDSHPEIVNMESPAPIVTFSDVEGGHLGEGNIDSDPRFVDRDNGNFHLLPGSPCIDTGTNAAPDLPPYDFEGDPRIVDGDRDGSAIVDMGIDEALWLPVHLPLVLRIH